MSKRIESETEIEEPSVGSRGIDKERDDSILQGLNSILVTLYPYASKYCFTARAEAWTREPRALKWTKEPRPSVISRETALNDLAPP